MPRFLNVLFAFTAIFLLSACGQEKANKQDHQTEKDGLKVYTTIYPLTFFTEEIGKEYVDVKSVLPAGVDEHTYEPTAKTIVDIADGDLFMYNGLGLEPFGEKVKKSLKDEHTQVVEVGKHIDLHRYKETGEEADHDSHDEEHEGHSHGGVDPHIWIDPVLAMDMAEVVKEKLSKLDPDHQEEFEKNYEELKGKLMKLDGDFRKMANQAADKEFLVSHAAFGYWEKEYGLKQISVAGLSPTNEPSQKQLKNMIDIAKKHQIEYVIFEQNVTPKVAKVVQKELKAKTLHIHNLSVLTEKDEAKGENYFTLMERNIQTLKKAVKK
ncbi:metal ABC transporter solute-binding protein, Zn/Mn family [Bacillus sp. FJAT-27231]|uniref:metal ABC transporter solute-binding protein, Zn/Mn family n=1 Tax=Bacillus sp. FJAT-27231 TaxID=1679168 RepID=UPI00069CF222|nr:zinc ABC transporter substrate-binding protein [Bacillus sp. FJAT-27231]